MKPLVLIMLLLLAATVCAQATEDGAELPAVFRINSLGSEYQSWNNCAPATLTNALVHSATRTINSAPPSG